MICSNSDNNQHCSRLLKVNTNSYRENGGSVQTRLCVVCVYCTWVSVALRVEDHSVYLTLSGVVIHSGRHRADFKKETPFITFMWNPLPPEMSLARWKQPFICSIIWADSKAHSDYVIAAYLELCALCVLLKWIRVKMG